MSSTMADEKGVDCYKTLHGVTHQSDPYLTEVTEECYEVGGPVYHWLLITTGTAAFWACRKLCVLSKDVGF